MMGLGKHINMMNFSLFFFIQRHDKTFASCLHVYLYALIFLENNFISKKFDNYFSGHVVVPSSFEISSYKCICLFTRYDYYLQPIIKTWNRLSPFRNKDYEERRKAKPIHQYECYTKSRDSIFLDSDNPEMMFPKSVRSHLVWIILINSKFMECRHASFETLLKKKFFCAAYPMHQIRDDNDETGNGCESYAKSYGDNTKYNEDNIKYEKEKTENEVNNIELKGTDAINNHRDNTKYEGDKAKNKEDKSDNRKNLRTRLAVNWASFRNIFMEQPMHEICEYFGSKIAFYFLWLGFYTTLLVPAAIVGLLVFFYGCASNLWAIPIQEICQDKEPFLMCPLCDKVCSYFYLHNTSCLYAQVTRCFENEATPIFSIFMSVWSVFYLSFWRRRESKYAYKWRTFGLHEMVIDRPEYKPEQKGKRILKVVGAFSVVLFFVCVVIIAVIGIVIYRSILFHVFVSYGGQAKENSKLFVTGTAAVMNLLVINVLRLLYYQIAVTLTNWENPTTMKSYEKSFTVKLFWFEVCNTYSAAFYTAFFKDEYFVGYPGQYKRILETGHRFEGCWEQGCYLELCIQLVVLMVGQQVINKTVQLFYT